MGTKMDRSREAFTNGNRIKAIKKPFAFWVFGSWAFDGFGWDTSIRAKCAWEEE